MVRYREKIMVGETDDYVEGNVVGEEIKGKMDILVG